MMKGRSANVSIALKGTEDKKDIVTIAQNAATEVEISKKDMLQYKPLSMQIAYKPTRLPSLC